MTRAFEKIRAGLEDAIAYAKGDLSRGQIHDQKNRAEKPQKGIRGSLRSLP
ncbi:hypothetical protein [Sphingomonas oligoaromativorans]|uniref:hypothetical protein n=1 Tax=Sphingomonas oligoaromativorans TaxID=575322 RepID=UPI0014226758|nr:hypothetical protein [Sphingomonas oligoaromativorans]NIJ35315.1 hypothetical protein [Sphingomonas oligoaromativorans]